MGTVISGRSEEQRVLAGLLASTKAEFLAIYGRRRVGKTFLVREFFAPRAKLFQVTGRSDGKLEQHLVIFAEALGRTFALGASPETPANWHDAFQRLRSSLEARKRDGKKVVLFFDELPWLCTRRSGCLEALEFFWNDWGASRSDLVLVVCGSTASFILERIVNAKGGLHNRLTRQLGLAPFDLSETRAYLRAQRLEHTERQLAELYMALGGIPYYLSLLERGESVAQSIDRLCLADRAPLASELDNLFPALFGADDVYPRVVKVLSARRQGLSRNELLARVGLTSGGGAERVLSALRDAGFIRESIPFGRSSRDRFYRVSDEFVLFALHWLSSGRIRGRGAWAKVRGKPRYHSWAGLAFESLCSKHVGAIKRALGISGVETSESAWHQAATPDRRGAQIDLVIDRADDVISLCEMKFSDAPFTIDRAYATSLRDKVTRFRERTGTRKATHLVLVTAAGLQENRHSRDLVQRVVVLSDLFERPREE